MGKLQNLQIALANNTESFYPGHTVAGSVKFTTSKSISISGMWFKFYFIQSLKVICLMFYCFFVLMGMWCTYLSFIGKYENFMSVGREQQSVSIKLSLVVFQQHTW